MRIIILLTVVLGLTLPLGAQAPETEPEIVRVSVDGVDVTGATMDRVFLSVRSRLTASRNLKVKRIRFERMRLGGVPVYLGPVEESLDLSDGVEAVLPAIDVTVYFRDLPSLDPLRQAVEAGEIAMTGSIRADLDLSLFERLRLADMSPGADIPLTTTVPLIVPGGALGQSASLAALDLAQAAMALSDSPLGSLRRQQSDWDGDVKRRYLPGLLVVESHYAIKRADGERSDMMVVGVGFRTSADEFTLPGELSEPWAYDVGVATALQAQGATLIRDATDLRVWPVGEPRTPASARSMAKGTIRQVRKPGKPDTTLVQLAGGVRKIRVARRDKEGNRAIYRLLEAGDRGAALPLAKVASSGEQSWERLILFRVGHSGEIESIPMPARRDRERITLRDAIDDRAFGSPLVAPDGVVGMVQDERGGVVVSAR